MRPGTDIRVLLVDDEPALLDLGKLYLEKTRGFSVNTAPSGWNALRLLQETPFDVIVSDYLMPGMDGISLLKAVRETWPKIPFIIFTGKGREEIVIEAINCGADYYIQKGGEPRSQYMELTHKIRRAVEQRRAESELREVIEILQALLSASPSGIALVRNRKLQWINASMPRLLGYKHQDMIGMHLRDLYETEEVYERTGEQIVRDLKEKGKATVVTRLRHRDGFAIDGEIHIAPLDRGNLHFGHMILLSDISRKLAVAREIHNRAAFPHLELTPVIETTRNGQVTYFNDAAIDVLIKYGNGETLDAFFPSDITEILSRINDLDVQSFYRNVTIGAATFRVHITTNSQFQIARISAVKTSQEPDPAR
ncbi:MAG: response regulator [Methanoregulaceae archaeon]